MDLIFKKISNAMNKGEKPVTCGIIITDTRSYLICHPTMSKWWDIPKGKQEPNETFGMSAVRELKEETGILVDVNDLSFLGKFDYKSDKQLALFYYQVDIMFDISKMFCDSTFVRNGKEFKEMDKFAAVTQEKMLEMVNPSLSKLLKKVLK